jgi:Skp family chaperone for outer membrane proteins
MGLKDVLEKMKLVEAEGGDEAAPPPNPSQSGARRAAPPPPRQPGAAPKLSMTEILGNAPAPAKLDERSLPTPTGDEVPDFPAIYKASAVTDPAHGFSAYKVLEILSSPDFAGLDPRAKAAALSGFLKMNPSGPVPIADVIQDAVARDRALDNFEQFLAKKLETRADELSKETAALQAEIDELTKRNQEKMNANRQALEQEKQRFAQWQARKRIEERKLFDAVGPFVEQNPVSVGSASGVPPGPTPPASKG